MLASVSTPTNPPAIDKKILLSHQKRVSSILEQIFLELDKKIAAALHLDSNDSSHYTNIIDAVMLTDALNTDSVSGYPKFKPYIKDGEFSAVIVAPSGESIEYKVTREGLIVFSYSTKDTKYSLSAYQNHHGEFGRITVELDMLPINGNQDKTIVRFFDEHATGPHAPLEIEKRAKHYQTTIIYSDIQSNGQTEIAIDQLLIVNKTQNNQKPEQVYQSQYISTDSAFLNQLTKTGGDIVAIRDEESLKFRQADQTLMEFALKENIYKKLRLLLPDKIFAKTHPTT